MKVQADNVNGVYVVNDFEGEVINQDLFFKLLKDNDDETILCAEIDDEMFKKIDAEYGIH